MPELEKPKNGIYEGLVKHCLDLYKDFEGSPYRKAKKAEIEESRKVYEQKAEKATFPWPDAANYIMPLTTIAIDNIEPRLVSGLIGTEPILAFDVEGKKEPIDEALQEYFNKELKDVIKVKDFARDTVHSLLNEGTYYCAVKYDVEKRKVKDFEYDSDGNLQFDEINGEPLTREFETTIFEGGKFDLIPFTDIYCADNLGTIEDWEREPVIRMVRPTYAELVKRKDQPGYMNIGKWLISEKGEKTIPEDQKTAAQLVDNVEVTGKEVIDCIECHLSFPLPLEDSEGKEDEQDRETFDEEKLIVTIALKSEVVIRVRRQKDINFNNEKTIKRIRLNAEPGRSFGTSVYGKIKSLQDGCSDLFNHMINVATIIMIPYFFYEDKAGLQDKVELKPGQGVPVDNVESIKFPSFSINPAHYMEFVEFFVSLWERSLSISDPQIGRIADRKETATAILTAVQEGSVKHNYQAEIFKEEFMAALVTMYDLYYKNMPYNKTLMVEGMEIVFPRKEMRRPYKFRLTGSTEKANKLISRKEAEDLFALMRQDPLADPMKLIRDVFKEYGKENPSEYINPVMGQAVQILTAYPQALELLVRYAQQQEMASGKAQVKKPPETGAGVEQRMVA